MEQKERGNAPISDASSCGEFKQIPRFIIKGQNLEQNAEQASPRIQRAAPKPPPRNGEHERAQRIESAFKLQGRYEPVGKSEAPSPTEGAIRGAHSRDALRGRGVVVDRIPFSEVKLSVIGESAQPEPKYAQVRKGNVVEGECFQKGSGASLEGRQTLPVLTRAVFTEASKYSIESQSPQRIQRFPVSPTDGFKCPPISPPEKGIFPYTISSEGGEQTQAETSHVPKSDSPKNSKVTKWMSSWLQFRHRRKAQAEHGPAMDRGGLDITPVRSEGILSGPRARFNERKERSRTMMEGRGQSGSRSGRIVSRNEGQESEPPKHIFSWRSTSGPIPPRLEAHTPPLLAPKLTSTSENTTNPWRGKKVEVGLLEPRALKALHSIPDQDRLSATLGKIFKASPHLRNALAHHFGVTQRESHLGPESTNEAVVLAVGIDLYIEEVFQQLDPENKGVISAEDFLLLCEVLSLPKNLPHASSSLNLEEFRATLFEHFVASFEETAKSGRGGRDILKAEVSVSRRAGILDKISQNIDKLLSTLEMERLDCECPGSKQTQICSRCKAVGPQTLKSPDSARSRIRELQTKVLSQQTEIHALREVVEDMRMALQTSDAENLALKVRLRRQQKKEGKEGIDRLVEELREIGQTGTPATSNSFDLETSSVDEEVQVAMQALQTARADLQTIQEELNQTAMRLMQKEREIEMNRETFGELRGTLEAAQLEIRRLQMELQESQTTLLFTQAELDGTSAELRAAKREIRKRDEHLRNMNEKLTETANSRERLLEELQRTRDLLAQCLSRVKQLELLQAISEEQHDDGPGNGSAEALSDGADANEPPKTDDSGLYSPVVSDKDEQEGGSRSRSRSREALSEDDLWHSPETDFEVSTNCTNSTVRDVKHDGIIRSLEQQINTLQKQLLEVQVDWEEERNLLLDRLSLSEEDRMTLSKSLQDARYESDRLKGIEDKLMSVLRSMATLHTMSLSRRSMGRILTDAVERSIDPQTNECNLFKFLATLQQSSSEMERVGTESLINLALSAV